MAFNATPNPASFALEPVMVTDQTGAPVTSTNPFPVTIISGGGAGGTQYSEDALHNSGDTGTLALVVQKTADAALSGDGDYSALQVDASGYLKVNVKAGTSTGVADNTGFTDGTTPVTPAGYIYDEVAGTALTENDVAAGRINVNRAMVHIIEDGVTRGRYATVNASNQLTVTGPVTNAGVFAVQDSEKLADNAGFTDGATKVLPVGYIYDEVAGTALTENDVGAARMDVKRAVVATLEDGTTRGQKIAINSSGSMQVQGQVASDGPAAGNPLLAGARGSTAAPTSVSTDGDAVALWASLKGALQVFIRDINAADAIGEVQTTPTANTVLGRLKDLVTSGTPYDYVLKPTVQALASTANAQEFVSDSTGFNKLIFSLGGFTTPSDQAVVISWSTTASDQSNVKTAIDSITTAATGKYFARDGVGVLNTKTLFANKVDNFFEVIIDPSTPVKTFGVEITGPIAGILVDVEGLKAV